MSDLGSNDCERVQKCNFAIGQYMRLLGFNAKRVKQVDIYHNPAVHTKFLAKEAKFTAAGKDTTNIWIFHGTLGRQIVAKICTGGF